jgi:hypothetical protein
MVRFTLRLPAFAALLLMTATRAFAQSGTVIPQLPATPTLTVSTVPANGNGDLNPYGVAFVPDGFPTDGGGLLEAGDIVVSNFNNAANLQGTGTTIVQIRNGVSTLFSTLPDNLGLTTALGVLQRGWVVVGNLPSTNTNNPGSCKNLNKDTGQGALLVVDRFGNPVQTLTDGSFLDGPWDLTIRDFGSFAQIFVSQVRSGAVSRLDVLVRGDDDAGDPLVVLNAVLVAKGYRHSCDPNAFVVGPTGVAFDESSGDLFVAATGNNTIYRVSDAARRQSPSGKGTDIVPKRVADQNLHGPLALLLAPNGDTVSSQGDAINPPDSAHFSEIVELTPGGQFLAEYQVNPAAGSAFGIALEVNPSGFVFAAVDDGTNELQIFDVTSP